MPVVPPEKLAELQQSPSGIRNICILAHVDHGKTSLTDALIATNGIISSKLAGKIRYLDSRPDEQLRGITMESSAISLYFSLLRRSSADDAPVQSEYLVNLIDSPGHIDFSSEVSTASRLCDGAVVLVDAVEGVCSQTVTVLRQTYLEKLKPLLVINKIDRLIIELKLSSGEAYVHLKKLLEQINAVMGSFFQGERMESDLRWRERIDERVAAASAAASRVHDLPASASDQDGPTAASSAPADAYEERDDEDLYFGPENNNVIFSSAIDGWAFTPKQFARLYEKKLGIKRSVLEKVLWGDYYLDPKARRVLGSKHLKGRKLKPMFVQLVLDNIWAVYEATIGGSNGRGDPSRLDKITTALGLTIPPHVLRSKEPRAILTAVFASWLPLSTALLVSITERLPSPLSAQAARIPALLESSPGAAFLDPNITTAMTSLQKNSDSPVVVYVSKMIAVADSDLPSSKRRGEALSAEEAQGLARKKRAEIARAAVWSSRSADVGSITGSLEHIALGESELTGGLDGTKHADVESEEHLIGFARVFSGTLHVGDEVYVISPRYSAAHPHREPRPKKIVIEALYLLMGRSLESLESAPAGAIVGIGGLEGSILKTGTLCSQVEGAPNLSSTGAISTNAPIVRVALEPAWPGDLDKMINGLRKLEQADPAVMYERLRSGEHVIVTAGEIHLERCLKDLRERFAKCEIQSGEVIVPYRESIVKQEAMEPAHNVALGRGRVDTVAATKLVSMRVCVRPLPDSITQYLLRHTGVIKRLHAERQVTGEASQVVADAGVADDDNDLRHNKEDHFATTNEERGQVSMSSDDFKEVLQQSLHLVKADREVWRDVTSHIAAFGPQSVGPNMLIDTTADKVCERFFGQEDQVGKGPSQIEVSLRAGDLSDKIKYAFQLACQNGPLCNEPMQGVAVFLESFTVGDASAAPGNVANDETNDSVNVGRLTGEVIRSMRDSIRQGFLDWSPRIMLAMYSCEIQASAEVLGRVYGVITRRRGRIVSEVLLEPSPNFTITALLPVAESFGFTDEIRKRTSGAASPQLVFQGYEMLDQDPFWVPTTEEELEDLGEKGDRANLAKRYVDAVRTRKGLTIRKILVEHAEKQKTLKR